MRQVKKGKDRKPHVFKHKNANGKNDTCPIRYTRAHVLGELQGMLRTLYQDKEVAGRHRIYYKSQLFADKPYAKGQFSRWARKYKEDEEISYTIEKIHEILEGWLWVGGLKGYLNATMVKRHLINNYGARKIGKVEVTGNTEQLIREIIKRSEETNNWDEKV